MSFLSHIRIVLVETSHPGNIGAVARAMKNMGLSNLHLVSPRQFPHEDAYARASGAEDVLNQAVVHGELGNAIAECGLIIGTSARSRHLPFEPLEPRECAALATTRAIQGDQVALLFGAERTGLTNDALRHCAQLVTIPTSDTYSSLNIAMAVQILAYELLLATRQSDAHQADEPQRDEPLASHQDMERFYEHLQQVLAQTPFRNHSGHGQLMARVRRIFNRTLLDEHELRILRGILNAVQHKSSS